ncbi:MAG: hypothetical protein ACRD12_16200, partial [Acidimicrobiales bacterium]
EGEAPFAKGTAIATLTSVVGDDARPMENTGRLTPLIADLLSKDPARRPGVAGVRRRLLDGDGGRAATVADVAPVAAPPGPPTMDLAADDLSPATPGAAAPRPPAPRRIPPAAPARRRPVGGIVAIVAVVIAALVAVGLVLQRASNETGDSSGSPPASTSESAVPAGWEAYEDPSTGFTIAHPPDWTVRTSGTHTDFRDPAVGAYLRVDHQQPPGPSPEGAWETLEASFSAQYGNYQRIRLAPTTYKGHRAAVWEFTFSDGGAQLHAIDLGMIAGDYGFALYFQSKVQDWDRLRPLFDQFKESFQPPT